MWTCSQKSHTPDFPEMRAGHERGCQRPFGTFFLGFGKGWLLRIVGRHYIRSMIYLMLFRITLDCSEIDFIPHMFTSHLSFSSTGTIFGSDFLCAKAHNLRQKRFHDKTA